MPDESPRAAPSAFDPPPARARQAETPHKAFSQLLTRTHPFYQDLEAGLREAAEERGWELVVQAGEFDVARQKDQVQEFLVRGVDAIVLSPCDSKSIGTSVKAANEAGIPVFTSDIAVLAPPPPQELLRTLAPLSTA